MTLVSHSVHVSLLLVRFIAVVTDSCQMAHTLSHYGNAY